jgi:hypothetical protein
MFRKDFRPTRQPRGSLAMCGMFGNIRPSSQWRHDSRRRIAKVSKP